MNGMDKGYLLVENAELKKMGAAATARIAEEEAENDRLRSALEKIIEFVTWCDGASVEITSDVLIEIAQDAL